MKIDGNWHHCRNLNDVRAAMDDKAKHCVVHYFPQHSDAHDRMAAFVALLNLGYVIITEIPYTARENAKSYPGKMYLLQKD